MLEFTSESATRPNTNCRPKLDLQITYDPSSEPYYSDVAKSLFNTRIYESPKYTNIGNYCSLRNRCDQIIGLLIMQRIPQTGFNP